MPNEESSLIEACAIYRKAHPKIQKLTEEMNRTGSLQEKSVKAKLLSDEAQALIDCEKRGTLAVCPACATINKVRKQTVLIIVAAGKLA